MYYIDQKIINIENSKKTPGYKRVTVELKKPTENKDGSKDVAEKFSIPEWELNSVATTEPSDLSEARNRRGVYVVDKIYKVLKELDVSIEEFPFYNQKLLTKMSCTEENAINNLFGVGDIIERRIHDWENNQ